MTSYNQQIIDARIELRNVIRLLNNCVLGPNDGINRETKDAHHDALVMLIRALRLLD